MSVERRGDHHISQERRLETARKYSWMCRITVLPALTSVCQTSLRITRAPATIISAASP